MVTMVNDELDEIRAARELTDRVKAHLKIFKNDRRRLDTIHLYLKGEQPNPALPPTGVPEDVKRLARMSRVNILELVVSSVAQALYVDGYRAARAADDAPAWSIWQRNRMDARQAGVHRAALSYGASYVTVLPGDNGPIIKGHSPRRLVALYGDDDDWPRSALEIQPAETGYYLRLFDETTVYGFEASKAKGISDLLTSNVALEHVSTDGHGAPNVPIVRFRNKIDLDDDLEGEVEQLLPIQDQIDHTTFDLLVAQQYAAFRQRWIIGWTATTEDERLKAGASRLWTWEDSPDDVKVGEFEQTDLNGYLDSREASIRHAASLSQTPAHELLGSLVNLSAEALVAAEASQRRKVTERQVSFGESWEQVLRLAQTIDRSGAEADDTAQVRWRDTESRALAQTVDALGKMATMLGIPPQELWERLPGVSQQDVERWRQTFEQGGALGELTRMLDRQVGGDESQL